jgi:hypothetical protein
MTETKKVHLPVLVEKDEDGFLWSNVHFFRDATPRVKHSTRL